MRRIPSANGPFVLVDSRGVFVDWRAIRRTSVALAGASGLVAGLLAISHKIFN